jgi:hypothetical protein
MSMISLYFIFSPEYKSKAGKYRRHYKIWQSIFTALCFCFRQKSFSVISSVIQYAAYQKALLLMHAYSHRTQCF